MMVLCTITGFTKSTWNDKYTVFAFADPHPNCIHAQETFYLEDLANANIRLTLGTQFWWNSTYTKMPLSERFKRHLPVQIAMWNTQPTSRK
jgi:hypothetical protein